MLPGSVKEAAPEDEATQMAGGERDREVPRGLLPAPDQATARPLSPRRRRVVEALVRGLVPETAGLDEPGHERVVRDVSAYVAGQVTAMPAHLGWAYRLGLTGFDLLPLALHGRRFGELAPAPRARFLAAWSGLPLAPLRDFLKLARSSALFAYFDHPLVRDLLETRDRSPGS